MVPKEVALHDGDWSSRRPPFGPEEVALQLRSGVLSRELPFRILSCPLLAPAKVVAHQRPVAEVVTHQRLGSRFHLWKPK